MSANSANDERFAGAELDDAIGRIETLYRTVTGQNPPPEGIHAPIPVEKEPAQYVQEQIDRLLGMLGQGAGAPPWNPPLSVWESEGEMRVRVDLPGVAREDVQIVVDGNAVTIRGRRRDENPPDGRVLLVEAPQGSFARRVLVPPTLRAGEPEAHLRDGVLELKFTRRSPQELAPRTVDVQ